MANLVSIQANPAQLEELKAALSGKELRQALWQATKRTTNAAVAIAVDTVMEHLNLTKQYTRRYVKAKMERGEIPVGTVTISGRSIPIVQFNANPRIRASKGGGAIVTISRNRPPLVLRHGFKATVRSQAQAEQGASHEGVFTRSTHLPTKGFNAGRGYRYWFNKKTGKNIKQKLVILSSGRAGSLALQQYMGPSIPKTVEIPAIEKEVTDKIGDRYQHELNGQMNRFTNGQRITD